MFRNPLLLVALAITGGIAVWGVVDNQGLAGFAKLLVGVQFTSRAWFIMLVVSFILVIGIGLALSPYGRLKLGRDDDEPEFGTVSWLSMLFAAGMGVVNAVDTSGTGLEGFQSANPHGRPLEVLDPKEQAELIRRIGEALALEPSRPPRRSERRTAGRPNVERLAEEPFEPDTAVANGASLAFLAEIGSTALLVGGDAHARTLVRSIRALLEERGLDRLPLGAFVVPHGGSRRNLSRELLELLACDKYLFSNNGAKFRLPDRETVARILAYGRASADVPLTLVFNYRTPETDIWDDKDLQQRYGYRAVYPEPGTEGIRVEL